MRLPIPENQDKNATEDLGEAVDLLRYGFEKGINYVDTAYMYCGGRSELAVGMALKNGWRKKVRLSTKLPLGEVKSQDDFKRILEHQLKKLDTDCIDFYHFHALSSQSFHNRLFLSLLNNAKLVIIFKQTTNIYSYPTKTDSRLAKINY